jgi:anti-sigma B factor antagonist
MTTDQQCISAPHVVYIEGEMTIYRAAEIKRKLLTPIVEAANVEVNLSKVTELDSAGVQLLMLAKRTAQAKNGEVRLIAQSPAVLDVIELLNLGPYFDSASVVALRAGK